MIKKIFILSLLSIMAMSHENIEKESCVCPLNYEPVKCLETGKIYSNKCFAKCEECFNIRTENITDSGECVCVDEYKPVYCQDNDKIYINECLAECENCSTLINLTNNDLIN